MPTESKSSRWCGAEGIYLNAGPTCFTRLGRNQSCPLSQFSTTVFTSLSEENLIPDKCLEPKLDAESGMQGVTPDFPLELSQQFLSFAHSMGLVMQEDDTLTEHDSVGWLPDGPMTISFFRN
ncbi:hypothetical protein AVEN_55560-1 [Araneus ventricosus]|uniref:Uncharacterized protein n=1 Tax=Araneus ventricosus TaxID=182803 RepID=A0A4Y2FW89_ARAVE|nr:hypothetical protein AVEN_55560-1 [Araneus ventricosus]